MKKQIVLLSFACLLFAGSQLSFAQSKMKQESAVAKTTVSVANQKALDVINLLERSNKLDAQQKSQVNDVFASVERKSKGIDAIEDVAERQAKRETLQAYVNKKLQAILTADQYSAYIKKMTAK
ncbi:MAG: hypothetical protein WA775_07765 [Psychroserpens sp.]|uniref:hypothetical protein n=1 Tax=Psychroserpens sp. TaxID=2020870 RepID=UPI003C9F4BB1